MSANVDQNLVSALGQQPTGDANMSNAPTVQPTTPQAVGQQTASRIPLPQQSDAVAAALPRPGAGGPVDLSGLPPVRRRTVQYESELKTKLVKLEAELEFDDYGRCIDSLTFYCDPLMLNLDKMDEVAEMFSGTMELAEQARELQASITSELDQATAMQMMGEAKNLLGQARNTARSLAKWVSEVAVKWDFFTQPNPETAHLPVEQQQPPREEDRVPLNEANLIRYSYYIRPMYQAITGRMRLGNV